MKLRKVIVPVLIGAAAGYTAYKVAPIIERKLRGDEDVQETPHYNRSPLVKHGMTSYTNDELMRKAITSVIYQPSFSVEDMEAQNIVRNDSKLYEFLLPICKHAISYLHQFPNSRNYFGDTFLRNVVVTEDGYLGLFFDNVDMTQQIHVQFTKEMAIFIHRVIHDFLVQKSLYVMWNGTQIACTKRDSFQNCEITDHIIWIDQEVGDDNALE